MIGDEGGGVGGGKIRQRTNRSGAKPYDRPQSILNRVGNAVRGVFKPSTWLSSLTGNQETVTEDDDSRDVGEAIRPTSENEHFVGNRIVATSRTALNSTASTSSPESRRTSNIIIGNENGLTHRIPMLDAGNASTSMWSSAANDGHHINNSNPPMSLSSLRVMDDGAVASTSTSFASPSNPAPLFGASSSSRRNFAADETNQRRQPSSRNRYARLCDIGRLSNDMSSKRYSETSLKIDGRDSQSECSDESVSTSGCSSMVPHPDKRDYQREILELSKPALRQLSTNLSGLQRSLQSTDGGSQFEANASNVVMNEAESAHGSRLQDRLATGSTPSFLFSENSLLYRSKPQPVLATNKPQFNSFLFGAPALPKKYDYKGSSSFCGSYPYGNKVSYGFGPSSYRGSALNSTAPYSTSARRQIQVKVAKTGGSEVMSSTTKQILETLEKMSTPIMDAKRIPIAKPDLVLDTPLTFTTTAYRRRPNLSMKTPSNIARIEATSSGATPRGPPVNKLMIPGSMAATRTYLRNVEMSPAQPSNAGSTRSSAESLPSFREAETPYPREEFSAKSSAIGKMRVPHQNASHYSRANRDEQFPEPPLPPSVPLIVGTLPKFDFLGPRQAAPLHATSSSSSSSVTTTRNSQVGHGDSFQFSTPVVKQAIDSALGTLDNQNVMQFTFSSPISVAEHEAAGNMETESLQPPSQVAASSEINSGSILRGTPASFTGGEVVSNFTFKAPPTTSPSLKFKSVKNDASDMVDSKLASGTVSDLKVGSVMDILMKPKAADQLNAGKANCDATALSKTSGFDDTFKPAAGSWECSSCMIRNNASASKCIACETRKSIKSDVRKTTAKTGSTTFAGFGDKFKPAAGSWECPGCMLRVDKDKNKCPSCETCRSGSQANETVAAGKSKSSVSSPFPSKFKASSDSWTCDTCLVLNSARDSACVACEVPKPGSQLATAPGNFKFGFKATSNNAQAFSTPSTTSEPFTNLTTTTATSTFKFGLPAASASTAVTSTTTPMTFGISKSSSETTWTTPSSLALAAQPPFKFGLDVASVKKTHEVESSVASSATGFKMPSIPTTDTDKVSVAAVVPKSTIATEESSFQSNAASGFMSSGFAAGASDGFKVENVASTTASVAVSNTDSSFKSTFSFGGEKPVAEKPPSFQGPTSSGSIGSTLAMAVSTTAAITGASQPSGGFGFKFNPIGPKVTSCATTSSSTPATSASLFSFGNQSSGAALDAAKDKISACSTQPAKAETPFSFGGSPAVGMKRNLSNSDGADPAKKAMSPPSNGTQAFGIFGAAGKQVPTATSEFSFGAMCSPPRSQPASGPIFGALSTTAEKLPSSSTFTFGANSSSASNTSLPAFGATSAFGAATPKAAPVQLVPPQQSGWPAATQATTMPFAFNFKRSSPVVGAASATTTASSTIPLFSFGSQTTTASAAANNPSGGVLGVSSAFGTAPQPSAITATPTFGSFGTAPISTATAPGFGAAPATNAGAIGSNSGGFTFGSTAPGFQFGGSAAPEQNVFTFTGIQNPNATQIPNAGFAYGQQKQQQQQQLQPPPPPTAPAPSGGFNFNPTNQLNFNFLNAPGIANQPPVFSAQQNPFDAVGSASRAGRTIKKAKRRNNPK